MRRDNAERRFELDATPSGFFALRTPLLPHDTLFCLGDGLEALRALTDRPEIEEAIFVASPSLAERLALWRREPDSARAPSIVRAILRYLERMAVRPTPFGLFAGSSVGQLGERTRLVLAPREKYQRKSRLDMHYLTTLIDALARSKELRPKLRYRPNTSLYRAAGRLRYVETRHDEKSRARSHHLVSVEESDYLASTLQRAVGGARPEELANTLVSDEISRADADEYIDELIDAQILIPEIEARVTGSDPLATLIAELRASEATNSAERLEATRQALASLDEEGLGRAPARYHEIADALRELPAKLELKHLFQVDLIKPAPEATLGPRVVDELRRAITLARRIGHGGPSNTLTRFRDAFLARWEDREMPLAEVLDEESGIGFDGAPGHLRHASPLLEGLAFPARRASSFGSESSGNTRRNAHLLRLLEDAWARGLYEIDLCEDDLRALENPEPTPIPESFAVFATIAAASAEAVDAGEFRLLVQSISGPSGANLLGRFCHADPALRAQVEAHVRSEEAQAKDVIFAEIVHMPQGRLGNVIARPLLRAYEIPFLGRSGAPPEAQIPITDLWVSVRGRGKDARVVLRSRRFDREVIPRLSNAHNFSSADVGIYRFLCALQHQSASGARLFGWGAMEHASFLPRVRTGRLILSLARFRLLHDEIKALSRGTAADRFQSAQALRERRKLPRLVALEDGDNILPIDLESALSVDAFVDLLKGRKEAVLIEAFPGSSGLCVEEETSHARFTHQMIVPFVRGTSASVTRAPAQIHEVERSFVPGSEWLYIKLYCGAATADDVLRAVVRPVVDRGMESGTIDQWFFLRYADPDPHIRLRFHGRSERLLGEILPALEELSRSFRGERIFRMQLDTYEREVERYGGPEGICLAERLFFADSEAALSIVETLSGDEGSEARWLLSLAGADRLLSDLGLSSDQKIELFRGARDDLCQEFGVGAPFLRQLDARYRRERQRLEELLERRGEETRRLEKGLRALDRRTEKIKPLGLELEALSKRGALSTQTLRLAGSFIHMHINRVLRSAPRKHELVLYDFLRRLHESRVARTRKQKDLRG